MTDPLVWWRRNAFAQPVCRQCGLALGVDSPGVCRVCLDRAIAFAQRVARRFGAAGAGKDC